MFCRNINLVYLRSGHKPNFASLLCQRALETDFRVILTRNFSRLMLGVLISFRSPTSSNFASRKYLQTSAVEIQVVERAEPTQFALKIRKSTQTIRDCFMFIISWCLIITLDDDATLASSQMKSFQHRHRTNTKRISSPETIFFVFITSSDEKTFFSII